MRDWRDGATANARIQATLPESVIWTEDPAQKVFGWSRPPERAASRSELLREGIEDYDYFVLLKSRADAVLGNASSSPEQTAKAQEALNLLKEMEKLIPEDSTALKYNQAPSAYSALRERVAQAIEGMTP